jgi:hypothetical protein
VGYSTLIIKVQQIFYIVQVIMSFVLLYLGFLESFFLSSFCVALSDFRYHYLLTSLYVFAISVVIVENDLENKIILVPCLSNTLCTEFFPYYHIIILKCYPTQYVENCTTLRGVINYSICFHNPHSGKWSHRARKRGMQGRQKAFVTSVDIFCLWSFSRLHEVLFWVGKDMLCHSHERKKAASLFESSHS